MKTFAVLLTAIFASRIRREGSTFRVTYGSFIPKQIRTFSPFRDNVVTMVALKMKETGMKKADMRESLENLFEHGCHCSWNKGRRKFTIKNLANSQAPDLPCAAISLCRVFDNLWSLLDLRLKLWSTSQK